MLQSLSSDPPSLPLALDGGGGRCRGGVQGGGGDAGNAQGPSAAAAAGGVGGVRGPVRLGPPTLAAHAVRAGAGDPHHWASLVWLCGPLSGLIVQPLVGHLSDHCASPLGCCRPYIAGGAAAIAASVLLIGYSADIGHALGDRADGGTRHRAIAVCLLGFWLLVVGNNTTQGPFRALLADLTGKDRRRTRVANAYFSLFMALGNVLGFAPGSYSRWFSIFLFIVTTACSINCANLKSAFLLDVVFLMITTTVSVLSAKEIPLSSASGVMDCAGEAQVQLNDGHEAFLWELVGSCKYLTLPIWTVLIVTALTWIGWFPFILFLY
ncbi:unnamed protein product [Musa hybrid cultivar]